jgi:hypothetical protein
MSTEKAAAPQVEIPELDQLNDDVIENLPPGALKRVLSRLRNESEVLAYADHDSHVMFGSHESHGSHGQHESHSSTAG